mgnify:CR=1 FL=1
MKENYAIGLAVLIVILSAGGYFANIYRLTQCDFNAPYKCEILRGIGVVTGLGGFFGWVDLGE